jgi:hypothetical protein
VTLPEAVSNRLIGALFVERGLVSQSQLVVALELQQETGQQLGQILVERFGVARGDLAKVVAEHWARMGEAKEDASTRASESWRQLGEILVSRGFVTREQLVQALERQRQTGERLGEALVGQGVLSKFELAGSLAEQASLAEAQADAEGEPANVVELAPRLEALLATEPGPGLVPQSALTPEPAYGTAEVDSEIEAEGRGAEGRGAEALDPEVRAAEAPEAEPSHPGLVAFASTPRGYRLIELENGLVPEVGKRIELPDVGELVVLRHGPSPLPADERICIFLEPPTPAGHTH